MGSFTKGVGLGCGAFIGWTLAGILLLAVGIGGCMVALNAVFDSSHRSRNEAQYAAKPFVPSPAPPQVPPLPDLPFSAMSEPDTSKPIAKPAAADMPLPAAKTNTVPPPPAAAPEKAAPEKAAPVDRLILENYERIKTGMDFDEVSAILGPADGNVLSASGGEGTPYAMRMSVFTWSGNWSMKAISITFQNGRVAAKAQHGLNSGTATEDWVDPQAEQAVAEEKPVPSNKFEHSKPKPVTPQWRTWTDASGAHKTEAEFKGLSFGKVKLLTRDGRKLVLPLDQLSDEDQQWIKKRSR